MVARVPRRRRVVEDLLQVGGAGRQQHFVPGMKFTGLNLSTSHKILTLALRDLVQLQCPDFKVSHLLNIKRRRPGIEDLGVVRYQDQLRRVLVAELLVVLQEPAKQQSMDVRGPLVPETDERIRHLLFGVTKVRSRVGGIVVLKLSPAS